MTTKILLDTDIGSDIDDAVCLAYLLSQPECDLLGITTVTGEGQARAMMASALCKLAGKQVPIYIGAEEPLLIKQRQPKAPQAAVLDKWAHDTEFPRGEAIEFLRKTIRQHPNEVVLLTIGPMTNAALLFASDPEIPRLLKGLVMMAGSFLGGVNWGGVSEGQEWNVILDPHAAAMVYRADVPVHRSVGLDVTSQVKMNAPEVRERFNTQLLQPVLDFAGVWFEKSHELTFHDPLAAATLFAPHICGFERGTISIELDNPALLGKTHWTTGEGSHEIATTVDRARFIDHYFGVVK
jgi:purine nucleosidase